MTSERKVEGWVVVAPDHGHLDKGVQWRTFDTDSPEGVQWNWCHGRVGESAFWESWAEDGYRVLPATLTIHEEGPDGR